MNINYNKSNKSIEIKDALKSSLLINLLMVLNLVNAILNLSDVKQALVSWKYMADIRTISIVILYNSILKKTGMDKIPIDQIKGWISGFLRKKKIFYRIKEWKNPWFIRSKIRIRIRQIAYHVYKMEF
jgi:hypothetical protein